MLIFKVKRESTFLGKDTLYLTGLSFDGEEGQTYVVGKREGLQSCTLGSIGK